MRKLFKINSSHNLSVVFALFAPLFFSFACAQKGRLYVNPDFSVNLAIPDQKFPTVKNLSSAGREAFETYGRPDFVRLWWSKNGRFHRYLEVDRKLRDKNNIYRLKHSWIYIDKDFELRFPSENAFEEVPLTDKIRTICSYGDPEDVKRISEEKPLKETWNYYSIGIILVFEDDKIVKEQRHNPMGAVIKR